MHCTKLWKIIIRLQIISTNKIGDPCSISLVSIVFRLSNMYFTIILIEIEDTNFLTSKIAQIQVNENMNRGETLSNYGIISPKHGGGNEGTGEGGPRYSRNLSMQSYMSMANKSKMKNDFLNKYQHLFNQDSAQSYVYKSPKKNVVLVGPKKRRNPYAVILFTIFYPVQTSSSFYNAKSNNGHLQQLSLNN